MDITIFVIYRVVCMGDFMADGSRISNHCILIVKDTLHISMNNWKDVYISLQVSGRTS